MMNEGQPNEPRELVALSRARRILATCTSLPEICQIRDKAEAARAYCRAARLSLDTQNEATYIKLKAERKAGELLGQMEKQRPGEYQRSHDATVAPSLSDLGINKTQSSRWQQQAKISEEEFESHVATVRESGKELTTKSVLQLAKRQESTCDNSETLIINDGDTLIGRNVSDLDEIAGEKFGCIYADPPWQYGNQQTRASTDNHYQTMTLDQICDMPIETLAADDAHLHLWTTNAFLFDARRVMESWGFEYRSCFVWIKPQMGIGNYWRVSHEFMLLGIRGNARRFNDRSLMSWAQFDRTEHSVKPDAIRAMIERASTGPYLELFGRRPAAGWTVFGNQIDTQAQLQFTA